MFSRIIVDGTYIQCLKIKKRSPVYVENVIYTYDGAWAWISFCAVFYILCHVGLSLPPAFTTKLMKTTPDV